MSVYSKWVVLSTTMEIAVLFNVLFAFVSVGLTADTCDSETGPAGSHGCVLFQQYYSKHQWATCITDEYMKTSSKGKHFCRDKTVTYCWYQCMLEINNLAEGPVYDDCACGPDAPIGRTTQPTAITSAIPDWCFSPSGYECNWYRECLVKRYPCSETSNSYALDYAEKFCDLYKQHYSEFDTTGQQWIDAVRKCLQVSLVPILRPFVKKTCKEIKDMAFESHPGCYMYPDEGKPSICSIRCQNWARVFWTVKSAFIQTPVSTFKQMIEVRANCRIGIGDVLGCGMELLRLKIVQQLNDAVEVTEEMLLKISNAFSDKLDWDKEGILHFGFPVNETNRIGVKRRLSNTTEENVVYLNLLLAGQSQFNLNANNIIVANVTTAAIEAANAVERGDVRLDIGEGMEFSELSVCVDYSCSKTSLQVIPAPPAPTYKHKPKPKLKHKPKPKPNKYDSGVSRSLSSLFLVSVHLFLHWSLFPLS